MGERGFPPTPTEVLRARGSWRANYDPARANEPAALPGKPMAPRNLTRAEKRTWKKLVTMLSEMRVLSKSDGVALERYVKTLSVWRRAIAFLDKNGEYYTVKDGAGDIKSVRKFPQVNVVLEYGEALLRIERQFGLTPSARSRVSAMPAQPAEITDGKGRFFKIRSG